MNNYSEGEKSVATMKEDVARRLQLAAAIEEVDYFSINLDFSPSRSLLQ